MVFSILCCVYSFICLCSMSCIQCCQCLGIVHSWLPLRFSLTLIKVNIIHSSEYFFFQISHADMPYPIHVLIEHEQPSTSNRTTTKYLKWDAKQVCRLFYFYLWWNAFKSHLMGSCWTKVFDIRILITPLVYSHSS
jgi:hypothetical protein